MTGNRYNVSNMKVSEQSANTKNKAYFKNLVIAFGVCLSFLTFTSADNWSSNAAAVDENQITEVALNTEANQSAEIKGSDEQRSFTHYNFIASYLIQESSINRQSKEKKEKRSFMANLKQIHKIIMSNTLGSI